MGIYREQGNWQECQSFFMGQILTLLTFVPKTASVELGKSVSFHSSPVLAGDQAFVTHTGGWDLYHICGCPHFIYYILEGPWP